MLADLFWKPFAWGVSRPAIADWIIARSKRTPYFNLPGYMNRWWVFNPYGTDQRKSDEDRHKAKYPWLPSIRVHHILREDYARDMHDHPWDARTIILKGDYDEERMIEDYSLGWPKYSQYVVDYKRKVGDTATLKYGEYHNITRVSEGGVWTLFFTWKYMGTWGFFVNGRKVPHKEYVNGGKA